MGTPKETTLTGIVTRIHGLSCEIFTSFVCFLDIGKLLFAPYQNGVSSSPSALAKVVASGLMHKARGAGTLISGCI